MHKTKQLVKIVAIGIVIASNLGVPVQAASESSSIVFTSNRDGTTEIYSAKRDGDNMKRLTYNTVTEQNIAVSPDGNKIAFSTSSETGYSTISILDVKTGKDTQILATERVEYQFPAWSPDGTYIAYSTTMLDQQSKFLSCVSIYNVVTNDTRKVSCADTALASPAWSPNGQKIIFTQFVAATGGDLYTVNAFSNEEKQFVRAGFMGVFSSTGDKIAYSAWDENYVNQIFVANSDGSSAKQITHGTDMATVVDWADDYITYTNVTPGTWRFQAKSIKADGSNILTIPQKTPTTMDTPGKGLIIMKPIR